MPFSSIASSVTIIQCDFYNLYKINENSNIVDLKMCKDSFEQHLEQAKSSFHIYIKETKKLDHSKNTLFHLSGINNQLIEIESKFKNIEFIKPQKNNL